MRVTTRPPTSNTRFRTSRDKTCWKALGRFNWRYDSGLVAGSVPCYNVTRSEQSVQSRSRRPVDHIQRATGVDLSGLTADQEFQAGLTCDGIRATPFDRRCPRLPGFGVSPRRW